MKQYKIRNRIRDKIFLNLLMVVVLSHCGGSSGGGSVGNTYINSGPDFELLTEKLIGTPFQGMENGDEIEGCDYMKDNYLTTDIPEIPIPIFLAFFNTFEENLIKEGVALANEAVGYDVFEVVEEWQDDARLIYQVSYIPSLDNEAGLAGYTYADYYKGNCDEYRSVIVPDWQIAVVYINSFSGKNLTAHELTHSFGMYRHYNIDFRNDLSLDLVEDSLIRPGSTSTYPNPSLDEFINLMSGLGQVLLDAIENDNYIITDVVGSCTDYLPDDLKTQIRDNYDSECR